MGRKKLFSVIAMTILALTIVNLTALAKLASAQNDAVV
jgi:hypothetical protein